MIKEILKSIVKDITLAFILFIVIISFLYTLNYFAPEVLTSYNNIMAETVEKEDIILSMVLAAIIEEIIFRAPYFAWEKLYKKLNFHKRASDAIYVVLSTLLFAYAHGNLIQMIYAAFAGYILVTRLIKAHNILDTMLIHATFNLINILIPTEWIGKTIYFIFYIFNT